MSDAGAAAQPVRIAPTPAQADEWALVLTAAGIAHAIAGHDDGWSLLVPAADVERARDALAAYDRENPEGVPPPPEPSSYPWMSGVTVALLLLAVFSMTGPPAAGSRWFARGAATARILSDEPWRAVTALTLHATTVHVLGNALAIAVLVPALVQRLGLGVAVCLLLLAGAGGNGLSALVHDVRHTAVGASTAAFGAIGALAALRLLPPAAGITRRRGWIVLAATLLLLAMLGTAPEADVVAHAMGLVAGAVLGAAAGVVTPQPPRAALQWALVMLAGLVMAGAWMLALLQS